eukprot:31543-Pelagococcus_subviridis.AAC.4
MTTSVRTPPPRPHFRPSVARAGIVSSVHARHEGARRVRGARAIARRRRVVVVVVVVVHARDPSNPKSKTIHPSVLPRRPSHRSLSPPPHLLLPSSRSAPR